MRVAIQTLKHMLRATERVGQADGLVLREQWPQPGSERLRPSQDRQVPEKLNRIGLAENDGNPGAGQAVREGRPSSPAALEGRHHGQRVHARTAAECWADGRIDVRAVDGRSHGGSCRFATECYQ